MTLETWQINDLVKAMERARELHGDDPPAPDVARRAITAAAEMGMSLEFQYVIGEEGMEWVARLETGRGLIVKHPRDVEPETWETLLEELLGRDVSA